MKQYQHKENQLSQNDIDHIKAHGLTKAAVLHQIRIFEKGIKYVQLARPCLIDDGIVPLADDDLLPLAEAFQPAIDEGRVMKFVPASGAATRMFQLLQSLNNVYNNIDRRMLNSEDPQIDQNLKWFRDFIYEIHDFAFFEELQEALKQKEIDIQDLLDKGQYKEILRTILDPDGLNYPSIPKALIKFHSYGREFRTAFEEHLVESIEYTKDTSGICRLHFTVNQKYLKAFEAVTQKLIRNYEASGITFDIGLSIQKTSTDTILFELDNTVFHNEKGDLVFNPGGHGSLLENLNNLNGDIIFLKNIDNIAHGRLQSRITLYYKALGGMLIKLQQQCFTFLEILVPFIEGEGNPNGIQAAKISEIEQFCRTKLGIILPEVSDIKEKITLLWNMLNRPIRVCGMIKNEGHPGGFPFWVKNKDNTISGQIVETNQVNPYMPDQHDIFNASTHFNPVNIVCGVRDFRGKKFDLKKFVDPDTCFISVKTKHGKPIQILEHPGLWNGSMADWITVFAEVPSETFSPVKQVMDLRKPNHQ
ncbi:MAG: DUF4301 family protein [Fibrobacteria bacterium]|nr:DUF4301 family protein [Fibrobacteria bacterium]